jgi:NADH-quinone oxidoreductase subunit N
VTNTDLIALSPLILTATAAVLVLVVASVRRHHGAAASITLIGLGLAGASIPTAAAVAPRPVGALLIVDGYALFYVGLLLAASFVVCVLAFGYLEQRKENREEFYVLVLLATLGAMVLVASNHFVSLFLGLEILSVGIYVLIAYLRDGKLAVEAGLKYLILAGASSAFLILGMALIYAQLGTMEFGPMAAGLAAASDGLGLALAGMALMVTGIGFKLALVPFHMWTPDVYEGAPAPVTAFVATVSKGGMFAVVLRFFAGLEQVELGPILLVFTVIAIASMLAGNLLALLQDNVKRILAYSSIAHLGYVLVAFLAGGDQAAEAVTFYLVAYFITTLAAFGVVTVLSDSEREADRLEDYRGLFWRRPFLAALLTAALLSLAGIPLTVGFLGKFFVAAAGVEAALWTLVIVLVAGSAIGLYYYLRLVVVMFSPLPDRATEPSWPRAGRIWGGAALSLTALSVSLIWLGVYPLPLIQLIEVSVSGLVP